MEVQNSFCRDSCSVHGILEPTCCIGEGSAETFSILMKSPAEDKAKEVQAGERKHEHAVRLPGLRKKP